MTDSRDYAYEGSELEVFADAHNWRAYWSSLVRPFLGRRVLEVGAGIGSVTRVLYSPGSQWTALEPDPLLSARIPETMGPDADVTVVTGSLATLPAGESFDSVIYIDVLEHIEHDAAEVQSAWDHLNRGGTLVVLAPAHQWLFTPFDAAIGHFRRYSLTQLRALRPSTATEVFGGYLDSAGVLASAGNRMLLRSAHPTREQIALWDTRLVPVSRALDRVLRHRIGKSVLIVWRKP